MKVALGPVQRTSSIGVPEEDFGVGLVSVPVECPNKGRAGAKTPGKALRESAKCTPVSYTHLDVYKRQSQLWGYAKVLTDM